MSATRGFAGIVPTESGGSGGGGGAVDSVFGRTGTVTAADGDYDSFYLSLDTAQTVVAVHTFNPTVAGAPFALGANATGQLVTGLNADKLDGSDASAFAAASHTHAASDVVSGQLTLARGGTAADLSATGPGFLKQASGGATITLAYQTEAETTFTDITTNNVSTSKHGYVPKAPNDTAKLLDGSGSWATGANITAGYATVLATARTINGTSFDGSANIVVGAIPQNSQSAAYTTVLADAGKHILHPAADTTARTYTIDSNANVAYAVGTTITFVNQNAGGVVTIAITSDTMRLAGAGTTGSRTLAANGIATALKITSTEWIISGAGLT